MGMKVTVYRFRRFLDGREISPRHMMGTPEAIAQLDRCSVIWDSARIVEAKLLESGFYFEDAKSTFTQIEAPQPVSLEGPGKG
ncbi:MAG TPA: hypothetical protein VLS49_02735 [Usitatibacter sp.]|nr:hypothetical protein [Usitatibacter sp.]